MDDEVTAADLVAGAQQRIADGWDPNEVFAHVRRAQAALGLNPKADLVMAVKDKIAADEFQAEVEKRARVAERGSLRNTAASLLQGASISFAPDIINALDFLGEKHEAGDRFREANDEFRDIHPVLSTGLEIGGGILIPGIGTAKAVSGVGQGLTRAGVAIAGRQGIGKGAEITARGLLGRAVASPLATATAVGATAGVGGGALFDFAESQGLPAEERMKAVREGLTDPFKVGFNALIGGGAGVLGGAMGSRGRRMTSGSRGRRVAENISETTGLDDFSRFRNATAHDIAIAKNGLDKVEQRTPEIVSDQLEEFLDNIRSRADILPDLNAASKEVAQGQRFATVTDMRELRDNLRNSGHRSDAKILDRILGEDVPGFEQANLEFFRKKSIAEALEIGERGGGQTFDGVNIKLNSGPNVDQALRDIIPEAHEALKTGMLQHELGNILGERTGSNLDVLKALADDSAVEMRLRRLFRSDAIAEEFIIGLDKEISATQLRTILIRGGVLLAVGAGGRVMLGSSIGSFLDN